VGGFANSEKPLLLSLLCKSSDEAKVVVEKEVFDFPSARGDSCFALVVNHGSSNSSFLVISACFGMREPSSGNKTEMGSLAGAAYLLNINAGVLRRAQWGQQPHVAHKGKSSLDLRPSVLV